MPPMRDERGRFLPGHNYSQGKSRGARNKLQADLLGALAEDFAEHGPAVIETVRRRMPAQYLKICVAVLPTDLTLTINPMSEMSDEDLHARMRHLDALYQESIGRTLDAAGGDAAPGEDGATEPLPALPAPKDIS